MRKKGRIRKQNDSHAISKSIKQGKLKAAFIMFDPKSQRALEIDKDMSNAMTAKFSEMRQPDEEEEPQSSLADMTRSMMKSKT